MKIVVTTVIALAMALSSLVMAHGTDAEKPAPSPTPVDRGGGGDGYNPERRLPAGKQLSIPGSTSASECQDNANNFGRNGCKEQSIEQ